MAETASGVQRPFTVLRVVLENGERLPCLVDSATWLPVRVGTRWAVRHRRYRVQSSTLVGNLRVLCRLYVWAQQTAGFDLDSFLTAGKVLDSRQVESLASELRSNTDGSSADTGAFDHRFSVIEDFLRWSLDSSNRGGGHPLTIARLSAERGRLHDIIRIVEKSYTDKQGQYLAFIYYFTKVNGRPPAEADMQRYFRVTPPSVHQVLTLEANGFIERVPGQGRSICLKIPREQLPDLE